MAQHFYPSVYTQLNHVLINAEGMYRAARNHPVIVAKDWKQQWNGLIYCGVLNSETEQLNAAHGNTELKSSRPVKEPRQPRGLNGSTYTKFKNRQS